MFMHDTLRHIYVRDTYPYHRHQIQKKSGTCSECFHLRSKILAFVRPGVSKHGSLARNNTKNVIQPLQSLWYITLSIWTSHNLYFSQSILFQSHTTHYDHRSAVSRFMVHIFYLPTRCENGKGLLTPHLVTIKKKWSKTCPN